MRYDICSVGEARAPVDDAASASERRRVAIADLQQNLVAFGFLNPREITLLGTLDDATVRAVGWLVRDARRDLVMNGDEIAMVGPITRAALEDVASPLFVAVCVIAALWSHYLGLPVIQRFPSGDAFDDVMARAWFLEHPVGTPQPMLNRRGYPVPRMRQERAASTLLDPNAPIRSGS